MNEAEWATATDPIAMLKTALQEGYEPSERKRLLFDAACGRRIWSRLPRPYHLWVEVTELAAAGLAGEQLLEEAERRAAESGLLVRPVPWLDSDMGFYGHHSHFAFCAYRLQRLDNPTNGDAELAAHADLLRDIFGPLPFCDVRIDPAWLTWHDGVVPRLAASVYEGRQLPQGTLDAGRLAVLADALEEAGCTDAEILGHCRGAGLVHVRGCWVIDLLLKKE